MEIRLFQSQDADRLAQLFHDTVHEVNIRDYSVNQVRAWAPEDIHFRNWSEVCADRFTYVAAEAGEIIGFGELEANGHIDCFYCHKDYQRRGVGTRIYRAIEAKALELGIERLYTEASITARAFFKSRGFAIAKEQQVVRGGEIFVNYAMEKNLEKTEPFVVATFYHFTDLFDYETMRPLLKSFCVSHNLKGTILLAPEGINSTIAGDRIGIDALLNYLRSDARLQTLEHKESNCQIMPFQKMQVRLKQELIKFGVDGIDPTHEVGIYVQPQDWNALISDPTVMVIDTRNIYEVEFGTFSGAVNPQTDCFSEFPRYVEENLADKQQKIAMFCTGGIRCEKASAYMLAQGFTEVYHLKGGILKYLKEVPDAESLWQGECFVFDDRISVQSKP
jgi:UPF0176 protein